MGTATQPDWDDRECRARIIVLETIQNQLLVGAARLSGAPEAFLHGLMRAAEDALLQAERHAAPEARQAAADAVASFRDRSMRIIAALTPQQTRQ